MHESVCGIIICGRSRLVCSLRSLWCWLIRRLWGLRRVCSRVRVVLEISSRCKTRGVWLLLGILGIVLLSSLALGRENWVRKGRGGGRIVSCILGELLSIAQIEVETIAVVVLHLHRIYVLSSGLDFGVIFLSK